MKVHSSTSSYHNSLFQSQTSTDSDDGTPFTLPGDDGEAQTTTSSATTGSTSTGSAANSISSAFWLSQSGASADAAAHDAGGTSSATAASSSADLLSEFSKLANMTPAEKIRDQYLKEHNMTEEQFSQLSPDEQKAINDQIADEIKQQLTTGKKTDGSAESDIASALSLG